MSSYLLVELCIRVECVGAVILSFIVMKEKMLAKLISLFQCFPVDKYDTLEYSWVKGYSDLLTIVE